ncbi:TPA: hypothetical protein DEP58_03155 [Patescibacteria group bacterium]|nr:MAG: hypothetical protein UU98_C0019G0002 [Parcubacteria group bacterium GW2011_GWD2_42_14]HCC05279.1 hypothetical protein [Patescibacteria group bacterium]
MNPVLIETIRKAVEARRPISFEYEKEGKVCGERIGNPHVVFAGKTRDGIPRVWIHVVQTGGVSDTLDDFPEWRMFIGEFIRNVVVLEDERQFEVFDGYNPDSHIYTGTEILAKI